MKNKQKLKGISVGEYDDYPFAKGFDQFFLEFFMSSKIEFFRNHILANAIGIIELDAVNSNVYGFEHEGKEYVVIERDRAGFITGRYRWGNKASDRYDYLIDGFDRRIKVADKVTLLRKDKLSFVTDILYFANGKEITL